MQGRKMYAAQSTHLPLKINTAGVIPAIFASALLLLPVTISNFGFAESDTFLKTISTTNFTAGMYIVKVSFNEHETSKKLIIE